MSRFFQVFKNSTCESIGLYVINNSNHYKLDSSDIEAIFSEYHYLCESENHYEAKALLEKYNNEKIVVEQEIFVG